jgi:hypothetical protein
MVVGPVRHPYAEVDFIPQSGIYEFGYWNRMRFPKLDPDPLTQLNPDPRNPEVKQLQT